MPNQSNKASYIGFALAGGLLVAIVAGIIIFMQSSQSNTSSSSDDMTQAGDSDRTGSGMRRGGPNSQANQKQGIGSRMVIGEVIAADASSITIETSDGTSRTFTVTDTTEVLPGTNQATQSYDPDNIEIGSTVAIGPNSSNSDQADAIALNYQTKTNDQ